MWYHATATVWNCVKTCLRAGNLKVNCGLRWPNTVFARAFRLMQFSVRTRFSKKALVWPNAFDKLCMGWRSVVFLNWTALSEIKNMLQCYAFPVKSWCIVIDTRRSCFSIGLRSFRRDNLRAWRSLRAGSLVWVPSSRLSALGRGSPSKQVSLLVG